MANVKHVEIYLSEDEYKLLINRKGSKSWKQFILELLTKEDKKFYMTQRINELFSYLSVESDINKEILSVLKDLTIAYLNKDYAGAYIYLEKLKELTNKSTHEKNEKEAEKEVDELVKSELGERT